MAVTPEPVPGRTPGGTGVPPSLVTASEWAWRSMLIGAAVWLTFYIGAYLSFVIVPVIVATFFTAVLEPIRRRLIRWGFRPSLASLLAFFVGLVLIGGVIALAASQVVANFDELVRQSTEGVSRLGRLLAGPPFRMKTAGLQRSLEAAIERFKDNPSRVLSGAFSILSTTGGLLAGGLLTAITTLFFVTDRRRILEGLTAPLGPSVRDQARSAGSSAWGVLCSYVQVTLIEATLVALVIGTTAALIRIPIAFSLAVIVFILGFIPTVGAILSGLIVTMAAYVTMGTSQAIIIAIVALVVQQLDANVLYPVLTSRRLAIHPLASLLLVTTGGIIGGLFGAFVAVPLTAMLLAARGALVGNPHELDVIAPP